MEKGTENIFRCNLIIIYMMIKIRMEKGTENKYIDNSKKYIV
jgi:hypothetical protein